MTLVHAPRLVLALILFAGCLIRLPHLTDPPLEFHPTRQYRSALLTRGYLPKTLMPPSGEARRAIKESAAQLELIEPPIMEHVAAWLYRAAGREALWMPRLVSVLAWMAGGAALWWLVAPLCGEWAGAGAVALFAFLPFGIAASQAFQPDALMTALICLALAAAAWRLRAPTGASRTIYALSAAAAIFIKPMAVFFVLPVELALTISRDRWVRGLVLTAARAVAICAPSLAWYVYVAVTAPGSLEDRFFPKLLAVASFWSDWLVMIDRVVSWPIFVCALAGMIAARGLVRRLLLGLWLGYAALGLLFTHHIHTHDYYSLPLIPVAAVSVAALIDAGMRRATMAGKGRAMAAATIAALVLGLAGASLRPNPHRPSPEQDAAWVARYERIGRAVGHSNRVISLDGDYGFPLSYHGLLTASNWPLSIDLAFAQLAGRSVSPVAGRLAAAHGEFFVATVQAELDAQPDLHALLDERYPVVDRDGTPDQWHYVVYDLQRSRISVSPDHLSVFTRAGAPRAMESAVSLSAADNVHWRATADAADFLRITPMEGTGPATLKLSALPTSTLERNVVVRVVSDNVAVPSATLTVRYRSTAGTNGRPFGSVDVPADPVTVDTAPVVFQGWALDDVSLVKVVALASDASGRTIRLGEATRAGYRPDVAAAYPNAHDLFRAAWAFTLDPQVIAPLTRPVTLRFQAEDDEGATTEIGRRTIAAK